MLQFLSSLFGKGKLVYEVLFFDGDHRKAKIKYVGSLATACHDENIQYIEDQAGKRVMSWNFLGKE